MALAMLRDLLQSCSCVILASMSPETRQLAMTAIIVAAIAGVCAWLCRGIDRFAHRALLRRNLSRLPNFSLVVTHHQVHRSDILQPTLVLLQARYPDSVSVLSAEDLQRPCARQHVEHQGGDGNRLFVTLGQFDEHLIVWCMELQQCRYVVSINEPATSSSTATSASSFQKQCLKHFHECPTTDPSIRRYERTKTA
jgi:hypothetical protein